MPVNIGLCSRSLGTSFTGALAMVVVRRTGTRGHKIAEENKQRSEEYPYLMDCDPVKHCNWEL
jgi:hypothetical protein